MIPNPHHAADTKSTLRLSTMYRNLKLRSEHKYQSTVGENSGTLTEGNALGVGGKPSMTSKPVVLRVLDIRDHWGKCYNRSMFKIIQEKTKKKK